MTFKELTAQIWTLPLQEKRGVKDNYAEAVYAKSLAAAVEALLLEYFGPPRKPLGQKPSEADTLLAGPYGGIYSNQVLYCRQADGTDELALVWPWSGGLSLTLKLARGPGR